MDPAFLAEARENAEAFAEGLLALEGSTAPDDEGRRATVRELFRFAHNIKGMAAMEGVDGLAQLAHAAEDLLAGYRDEGGVPTSAEIDALLAASDGLESMLAAAEAGRPPEPADATIAQLRSLVGSSGSSGSHSANGSSGSSGSHSANGVDGSATAGPAGPDPGRGLDGDPTVAAIVEIDLAEQCAVPRARAMVVVRSLGDDVVATDPVDLAAVDRARPRFAVGLRRPLAAAAAEHLRHLPDVASVETRAPQRPRVPPAEAAAPDDGAGRPAASPGAAATGDPLPTIRVEVDRLDDLMDLVGELVIEKNRLAARVARARVDRAEGLATAPATGGSAVADAVPWEWLDQRLEALGRLVSDLGDAVARVRMVSLEATFARMQRLVRDVSRDLAKPVRLELEGAGTELDRSVVDEVMQPLVHLLRNAVDHGIEAADQRRTAGKAADGLIRLRAYPAGAEVVIEVSDDGGGIDTDRLGRKAVQRSLLSEEELARLPAERVLDLMFLPGFSSRDEASLVSGRGVGLDVVKSKVQQLGGSVSVSSVAGAGTTFRLRFPLSLLVMDCLLVRIVDGLWALPLARIAETVRLGSDGGPGDPTRVVRHRGVPVPVLDGARWLAFDDSAPTGAYGVVMSEGDDACVLSVDELVDRIEVVVKPVPPGVDELDHLSGVTVLGEGDLALVPDLSAVVRRWRLSTATEASPRGGDGPEAATSAESTSRA